MKRIFLIFILFSTINNFYSQELLAPFENTINTDAFVSSVNSNGQLIIKIEYNTISVRGHISMDAPSALNTGQIVELNTPYQIPDMDLGYINNAPYSNSPSSYFLSIENNWIKVSSNTNEVLPTYVTLGVHEGDMTPNDSSDNNPKTIAVSPEENSVLVLEPSFPMPGLLQSNLPGEGNYKLRQGVRANVSYYDGLGRVKEQIAIQGSPQSNDIIEFHKYQNGTGLEQKKFLPYTSNSYEDGAFTPIQILENESSQYYSNNYPEDFSGGIVNHFTQKVYSDSPLRKVLQVSQPGSDWSLSNNHNVKFEYDFNVYQHVKKFKVNHPNDNFENTELYYDGSYHTGVLTKNTIKDENWTSGNLNTTEEFTNRQGQVVLKRAYDNIEGTVEALDTYYVYDDFGNLTYVIPPLASDQVTVGGNQGFLVGSQTNFPWTDLVAVDRKFAEEYNKRLEQYENEQILNADIKNEYNGQGGFTVTILEGAEELTLNLNFSANKAFALKKGELLSLKPYGRFKDTEVGRIKGDRYEYIFLIKNNSLIVEGDGELSSISQSLNSSQKLTYSHNYPWVDLMELDPGFVKKYKEQLGKYKNEDILNVSIPNEYNGTGGLNISVDKNDMVNVTMNLSTNTPFPLQKGMVIPLKIERKLEDRQLGEAQVNDYRYSFSIKDNQLYISGSGGVQSLTNNFSAFGTMDGDTDPETVEGLCYIYHYDSKSRLVEKKIPGKGWEYIVYDKLDRPILTQDANMRLDNEWQFTKYDVFDRPVYTGIYTYAPNGSEDNSARLELQDLVNNQTSPVWSETRGNSQTIDGVLVDYTNSSFPTSDLYLLTVNYYDEYFYGDASFNPSDTYNQGITEKTKGLSTNSRVRILGTNNWIDTFTYYDEKARPIFLKEFNEYFSSQMDLSTKYDFIGNMLYTRTVNSYPYGNEPTVTINDAFTYDHQNRLKKHMQMFNGTIEVIAENHYDELGKLVSKDLGRRSAPLQEVNYEYNIRGWLKSINPLDSSNSLVGNDLFSFGINYNQPSISGTQVLFNGNISETHWKTANDNLGRAYAYGYDALNQLTDADYHGGGLVANTNDTEDYSMQASYDKNGNIIDLERKGTFLNNGIVAGIDLIDDLVYDYRPKTNQLERVTDSGYDEGFKDVASNDEDYTYDANGNLKIDRNKGITKITYNHLNLPEKIIFRNNDPMYSMTPEQVKYTYDALGNKLSKTVYYPNLTSKVTKYINGLIYEDNVFKYYPTGEGYVEPDSNGGFDYVYQYKDHLGNVRLSYKRKDHVEEQLLMDSFTNGTDGWSQIDSQHGSIMMESGKLKVTIKDKWYNTKKYPVVEPNEPVHIEFDFETGTAASTVFFVKERINGSWEPNSERDSFYLSSDGHFSETLILQGNQLMLYFEKPNNAQDGTSTTFYVDNFSLIQITEGVEIVEENNYYPFGLEHKGYNNVVNGTEHPYKYNGKELNEELGLDWYDYGARNYDAALGRWFNIDPLAENYLDLSPYNYVANNPIFYIDPDGMKIKDPDKVAEKYKNHLNTTAAAIKSYIKSGAISEEDGGKLTSFTSSELKKIEKLEKSDQVYTFSSKTTSKEGGVQYDASTEEVKVTVGKGDVGLIGHELNHAYQFEKGDISIMVDNSGYGSLYDVGDETESYNVERMAKSGVLNIQTTWKNADVLKFGKTQMSPPAYQTLPTISIKLKSKQGRALRKKTIEAGKNGTPVKEVYIGWQKDYAKGAKKKK